MIGGTVCMIIVKVSVPSMEKEYDFQIDEDVVMFEIRNEIIDMICRRNQCEMKGDRSRIMMWDAETKKMIDFTLSAAENGLRSGSALVLA